MRPEMLSSSLSSQSRNTSSVMSVTFIEKGKKKHLKEAEKLLCKFIFIFFKYCFLHRPFLK